MATQIKLRRDTNANWNTNSTVVLAEGEIGVNLTNGQFKLGNGVSTWAQLTYFSPSDNSLVNGINELVLESNGTLTLPAGGIITEGIVTSNPTIQLTPASPTVASQRLVIKGGGLYDFTQNGININYNNNTATSGATLTFYVYSTTYTGQTLYWWIYPQGAGISNSESGTVTLTPTYGEFSILVNSDAYEFTVRVSPEADNYNPANTGVESGLINAAAPSFGNHHLHLTTGNLNETSIFLGTDDHNVRTTPNDGIQITTPRASMPSNVWTFDDVGDLNLPDNGGIVFDRANTSIRVGMGFHIASGEGIDIQAIDESDPNNLLYKNWYFGSLGTMTVPSPTSTPFPLVFSSANYVPTVGKPTLTLTDTPWALTGQYAYAPDGRSALALDDIWPTVTNPGYESGDTFTFDSSVHGISGFVLTITLNDVVLAGPAGWTANVLDSAPPVYQPTISSAGPIKLTSNNNSLILGTNGSVTVSGNIRSTNSIDLQADDAVSITTNNTIDAKTWTFDEAGSLTFPDNTVQTTADFRSNSVQSKLSTVIYNVTVAGPQGGDTGNKYLFNGVYRLQPTWVVGYTYVFVQDDPTNVYFPNTNGTTPNPHPLNFSADNLSGQVGFGTSYLQDVRYYLDNQEVSQLTYNNSAFNTATSRQVWITITNNTPSTLYYWCWNHLRMGNSATISNPGSTGISWTISASGETDYVFSGPGIVTGNTADPILYLYRGFTYTFVNTTGSDHPFAIRVSDGGAAYTVGVSGSQTGTQTFIVPMNAPSTLYYQCTIHSTMGNVINIV